MIAYWSHQKYVRYITGNSFLFLSLFAVNIDIRKRDGLATLLLSIFYLQLSTPEANIAQLVW